MLAPEFKYHNIIPDCRRRDLKRQTIPIVFRPCLSASDPTMGPVNKPRLRRDCVTQEEPQWAPTELAGYRPYENPRVYIVSVKMPPMFSLVGTLEPFHRETLQHALALEKEGIGVTLKEFDGCYAFDMLAPEAGISRQSVGFHPRQLCRILRPIHGELGIGCQRQGDIKRRPSCR